MAVVGDNRGVRDRPGVQRPDGSWSFEDARRRRDQRQGGETSPGLRTGDPEEDLSALALSLADNLTVDGTPLSELETRQKRGGDALGLPASSAPTAEEIMHALETEQHAASPTSTNGGEDPRRVVSAPQPDTRRGGKGRWLHGAPSWVIACIVSAGIVTALVGQLASGAGTPAPRHPGRALATGTAATTVSLGTATARFLAVEHAADRNLGPARTPSTRAARLLRHRQTSLHNPPRRASPSSSTTTSSASGTSVAVDTAQQSSPSSSGPSSGSASSGSGQGSPATQPHTAPGSNSGSRSSTPSKATLRSLVTGAGTCSCQ
jgi:hypothetical protein